MTVAEYLEKNGWIHGQAGWWKDPVSGTKFGTNQAKKIQRGRDGNVPAPEPKRGRLKDGRLKKKRGVSNENREA